jgi:cytochrome P450
MPGTETASSAAVPFDPYELKDVVGGTIRDPYPLLHELRRQSPVHSGPIDIGEGVDEADPNRPAPITVFGFDEVVQVLKDNETFSSVVYSDVMGMVMGRTVLEMDEPEHRQNRALVAGSFRTKMLERWEEGLVALVVNELIDTFIDSGQADLVRTITFNYPVQVIARILGLPRSDYPIFQRWAIELTSVAANWERGVAASVALRDYFAEVMTERRATPGDDLISDLVRAEVDGERLTDEEIYSFLRLILPAGVETTYRASGSLLYALLHDQAQFDALYQDRSLYPQAFEESLRWEPPVTVILRRAMRDTALAGVKIEKGADIALMIGAANRDERKWPAWSRGWRSTRCSTGWAPSSSTPRPTCRTSRAWPSARPCRCRWCSRPREAVSSRRAPRRTTPAAVKGRLRAMGAMARTDRSAFWTATPAARR